MLTGQNPNQFPGAQMSFFFTINFSSRICCLKQERVFKLMNESKSHLTEMFLNCKITHTFTCQKVRK